MLEVSRCAREDAHTDPDHLFKPWMRVRAVGHPASVFHYAQGDRDVQRPSSTVNDLPSSTVILCLYGAWSNLRPHLQERAAVGTEVDREHRLRRRAELVTQLLRVMWGSELPPGPHPQLTALVDALAGDDETGRSEQFVVHGDGLTYQQLLVALTHPAGGPVGAMGLPPRLVQRLRRASKEMGLSPGLAALPDERCGAWELDAGTGVVSFDDTAARLLGIGHRGGQDILPASHLSLYVHPEDRHRVADAVAESLDTGHPYQSRFRVVGGEGAVAWVASRARVLTCTTTDSHAARLVGFLAPDEEPAGQW